MANEKVHDFRSLAHRTLAEMAVEKLGSPIQADKKIEREAAEHGHDGFMPAPVAVPGENGLTIRGNGNPTTSNLRGRIFVFVPANEKVTVLREKVGQTYDGVWIHEVTNRAGKKFLVSVTQLKEPH